jgi:hypothetical protein
MASFQVRGHLEIALGAWTTNFKETGGKIGYKISGTGYIVDKNGDPWGTNGYSIARGPYTIKPGGSAKDDYWCYSANMQFLGGYAQFEWSGEDAGGHHISFMTKVSLQ